MNEIICLEAGTQTIEIGEYSVRWAMVVMDARIDDPRDVAVWEGARLAAVRVNKHWIIFGKND